MSIESAVPTDLGPVDHWYQLHMRVAEKGIGFPGPYRVFGPMDRKELLAQIQQILNCEPDANGEFAHSAVGLRIDVDQPCVPWKVSALVGPIEKLGLEPGNNLGLLTSSGRINATVEYQVGVDLNKVTQAVSADLGLQRHLTEVKQPSGPPRTVDTPIVGYRTWAMNVPSILVGDRLVDGEPQFFGPNWYGRSGPWEWRDAEVVARCLFHSHRSPALDCSCGVYAHHDCVIPYGNQLVSRGCYVEGKVLGTGDVLIYEGGWRAECARIIGLSSHGVEERFLPALHQLARKFDVPVVSRSEMWGLGAGKGRIMRKSEMERGLGEPA